MNYKKLSRIADAEKFGIENIPEEAWEYFCDDGGIPVTDNAYNFHRDPYKAIARVLNECFKDAMGGVTGGGIEEYYAQKGEDVPNGYKEVQASADKKAQEFLNEGSPWGEVGECTADGGIVVVYPPYKDGNDEPYGYYSAWDDSIHSWEGSKIKDSAADGLLKFTQELPKNDRFILSSGDTTPIKLAYLIAEEFPDIRASLQEKLKDLVLKAYKLRHPKQKFYKEHFKKD